MRRHIANIVAFIGMMPQLTLALLLRLYTMIFWGAIQLIVRDKKVELYWIVDKLDGLIYKIIHKH